MQLFKSKLGNTLALIAVIISIIFFYKEFSFCHLRWSEACGIMPFVVSVFALGIPLILVYPLIMLLDYIGANKSITAILIYAIIIPIMGLFYYFVGFFLEKLFYKIKDYSKRKK
ncbi:MAG: hypothetical protein AABW79_00095 [Nanoarchaeota archaeon]